MDLKTTITGLLTFVFNLVATFGIELDVKVQVLITSILVAILAYFAKDSGSEA